MAPSHRTFEAKALLRDIGDWCARTDTPETAIGHALFRHPGFVGLLRKRLQLSAIAEDIVRRFMAVWPKGYHGELPYTHANEPKLRPATTAKFKAERGDLPENVRTRLSDEEIAARRIDRDACTFCGVRADIGCKHRPPS